jgi:hypothetical protein
MYTCFRGVSSAGRAGAPAAAAISLNPLYLGELRITLEDGKIQVERLNEGNVKFEVVAPGSKAIRCQVQ